MSVAELERPRSRRERREEEILDALVAEYRPTFALPSPHRIYRRGCNEALRNVAERLGLRAAYDRRVEINFPEDLQPEARF
jgi:hypothetical protein